MPTAEPTTPPAPGTRADLSPYARMTWHTDGPHHIAALDGIPDSHEGIPLHEALREPAEQGAGDLVLDLRDVEFPGPACLGALAGTLKKLRPKPERTMRLVPGDHVRKVLHHTGLTLHEDLDDALAAAACAPADGCPPPADVVLLGEPEFTAAGPYACVHLGLREGAAALNTVRDGGGDVGPALICHDHDRVQVPLVPGAAEALRDLPAVVAVTDNTGRCGGPHRRSPIWVVPRHDRMVRTDPDALRAALAGPAPTTERAARPTGTPPPDTQAPAAGGTDEERGRRP